MDIAVQVCWLLLAKLCLAFGLEVRLEGKFEGVSVTHDEWTSWTSCTRRCYGGRFKYYVSRKTCRGGVPCAWIRTEAEQCGRSCERLPYMCGWSGWSSCSASCGLAVRARERKTGDCYRRVGRRIIHVEVCNPVQNCEEVDARRIDPKENTWSTWSDCSVSCGSGTQTRQMKRCDTQRQCETVDEEQKCWTRRCYGADVFSDWSSWSPCSSSCGAGTRQKRRRCLTGNCRGPQVQTATCFEDCPDHEEPGWSQWSHWDNCSGRCGSGSQRRVRVCSRPRGCPGSNSESRLCDLSPCPPPEARGVWGDWRPEGSCSRTCGGGRQRQVRTCSGQPSTCQGESERTVLCNDMSCPRREVQRALWGEWSPLGTCTRTCGGGLQRETRVCSDEPPTCESEEARFVVCNTLTCPEDTRPEGRRGVWGEWIPESDCSSSCGGGLMRQVRICRDQPPTCQGESVRMATCNTQECGMESDVLEWTSWTLWSTCSASCDYGSQHRSRECRNGVRCPGESVQSRQCKLVDCPVTAQSAAGVWGEWRADGQCSRSCDGGVLRQRRTCISGECQGESERETECNEVPCGRSLPVAGGTWREWGDWGACDASCGGGTRRRTRECSVTGACQGGRTHTQTCATEPCEEAPGPTPASSHGGWSVWGTWDDCATACRPGGPGEQRRFRLCPSRDCPGLGVETRGCAAACSGTTGWTEWEEWEECSVLCGKGTQVRQRQCRADPCEGDRTEDRECRQEFCP